MTAMNMEISEQDYTRSANPDFGMEHVLASYVRRKGWSIKEIMARFDLTDGQARGVMYAAASRSTLNHVVKVGGWRIGLMLVAGVVGHTLSEHIEQRRANERKQYERMDASLRQMAADLPSVFGMDRPGPH